MVSRAAVRLELSASACKEHGIDPEEYIGGGFSELPDIAYVTCLFIADTNSYVVYVRMIDCLLLRPGEPNATQKQRYESEWQDPSDLQCIADEVVSRSGPMLSKFDSPVTTTPASDMPDLAAESGTDSDSDNDDDDEEKEENATVAHDSEQEDTDSDDDEQKKPPPMSQEELDNQRVMEEHLANIAEAKIEAEEGDAEPEESAQALEYKELRSWEALEGPDDEEEEEEEEEEEPEEEPEDEEEEKKPRATKSHFYTVEELEVNGKREPKKTKVQRKEVVESLQICLMGMVHSMVQRMSVDTGILSATVEKGIVTMLLRPEKKRQSKRDPLAKPPQILAQVLSHPAFDLESVHLSNIDDAQALCGIARTERFLCAEFGRIMKSYNITVPKDLLSEPSCLMTSTGVVESMAKKGATNRATDALAPVTYQRNMGNLHDMLTNGNRTMLTNPLSLRMMGATPKLNNNYDSGNRSLVVSMTG